MITKMKESEYVVHPRICACFMKALFDKLSRGAIKVQD